MVVNNYDGLAERLIKEVNNPLTLSHVWELREDFSKLPKEVLAENPSLAICVMQVLTMEGKLEEAQEILEMLPKESIIYDYARLVLPTLHRREFRKVVEKRMEEAGEAMPQLILTAGRPSVLNGFRDFTEYGRYIKQLREPIVKACQVLYGDAAAGVYEIALAEHLYWKNECFEALVLVVGAIPFMENIKDVRCLFAALTLEIFILTANGQTASIKPLISNLRKRVDQYGSEELEHNLMALEIWADMYDGNTEVVNKWMQEDAPDEHGDYNMLHTFGYIIKLRGYLIQEKHMALFSLAERMKALLKKGRRWMDLCEVMLIQAMSFHCQGKREQAFALMDEVINYAKRYGYDRLIGDEGGRMYRLLYDYRRERGSDPYLTRIMDIARRMGLLYPNYLKAAYSRVENITRMEKDVLKLMAEEHTNEEISEYLDISINTVKFHKKNIYKKLSASSRGQAVKIAKEMGFLYKKTEEERK